MPVAGSRVISHFSMFHYKDPFYVLSPGERQSFHKRLWGDIQKSVQAAYIYQIYPALAGVDFLVWSSQALERPEDPAQFFERLACALLPYRQYLEPAQTFWGLTQPSQYSKSRATQEIDPLIPERKKYLFLYPFVKTPEWYLLGQETRQGIMNGHIKVGKQYPQIDQLLLYSFGLQDQEFVVVYETDDLSEFSSLVYAMRNTEARRYTERDTPLYTGIYHPGAAALALWEG